MEARVDIRHEAFDTFIKQRGLTCNWQEAMLCYCLNDDYSQPDYNCSICKGTGFYYKPAVETLVAITALNGKTNFQSEIGTLELNTAVITTLSTDLMGYNDRLEFPKFNSKYSEILTFTSGISKETHKKIKSVLDILGPDRPIKGWKEGLHFKINEDGWSITWIDANTMPPDNQKYSVLYTTSPTYIISDIMHELRGTMIEFKQPKIGFFELPKQYMVRREDFSYVHK